MTIDNLLEIVRNYNPEEVDTIRKAYDYAEVLHKGQYRQSGEPYITHPLNVAYILAEMHADRDTVCAGLLHDTLEDTDTTKEDIADVFNKNIANLVDGVTKLAKMNFSSKEEQNLANTRKIITGITSDVRIIIIKLADRLHNMRTLEFKSEFKQKENALETMEIFVPLAYYIGAYRIKSELEDLSLKYLKPDMYKKIAEKKLNVEASSNVYLQEMLSKIQRLLNDKSIPNEIKIRTKNIYGINKKMNEGYKLNNIHDLLALKIVVENIDNCYKTLGIVHSLYNPFNSRFKDYLHNSKTNNYSSIHTTVFAPEDKLVQTQIRTFEMDKVASFGLPAYIYVNSEKGRKEVQDNLKNKFQFFERLQNIDNMYSNNEEFLNQIKSELFSKQIYVYTSDGTKMELPYGSTLIDYAYRINKNIGDHLLYGIVNDIKVTPEYLLQNNDRIILLTNNLDYTNIII